jgi:hypothetical protein
MTSSAIEIEARSMARSSSREDPTGLRGPTSTSSWRSSSREDPPVGAHDGAHTDEGALDEDAHDDAEPSSIAISKQTAIRILREVREQVRERALIASLIATPIASLIRCGSMSENRRWVHRGVGRLASSSPRGEARMHARLGG